MSTDISLEDDIIQLRNALSKAHPNGPHAEFVLGKVGPGRQARVEFSGVHRNYQRSGNSVETDQVAS